MVGDLLQTYVAGHSGDHGNDEADRLAKEGAEQPPCGVQILD
jgi:ribonuclease HI